MRIKRVIEKKLREHLQQGEITLLVGPRQVGKTTLITELSEELKQKGAKVLTLNLDIEDDFTQVATQAQLLNRLHLEFANEKGYIFIDEVQRKENAGRFFKGIYDMNLPYKFILTGSGSVELKENISESLAGRKQMFEMHPVSFIEFIDYKTNYNYSDKLEEFILNKDPRLESLFQEYLRFGGYPRIIIAETLERKRAEMQEIYTSYLEKDIMQLLRVQKTEAFSKLLTILSSQIGQGLNIEELSSTLNLDSDTIKNYLWYLEKTFIIHICRPYYTNPRSELSKTAMYYFFDLGMRNYAYNRFNNFDLTLDGGHIFENFIFNHLHDKYESFSPVINYWRTKDGAEVDFIFKLGTSIIPIEAKFRQFSKPKVGKSMYSFLSKYNINKAYIVNRTLMKKVSTDNAAILFTPYNNFLVTNIQNF